MCFFLLLENVVLYLTKYANCIIKFRTSFLNYTYTMEVLMNGLKFWNSVSVGLQIVLLKHFWCIKSMIFLEFALKCTCSLICRKVLSPLKYQTFLVDPDLNSCIIIVQNMEVIVIQYLARPPNLLYFYYYYYFYFFYLQR